MAEKTTVSFRINESVKEEWEKAAEGPEYNSLSHLIRLSVQREINGEDRPTHRKGGQSETNEEVLQSLNRLERTVDEIQDEVEATGRENRSEELYDLEQVLLEVLPTAPETYNPAAPDDPDATSVGQKPREIAGKMGADTSDVSDALKQLDEKIAQVQARRNHYWKKET